MFRLMATFGLGDPRTVPRTTLRIKDKQLHGVVSKMADFLIDQIGTLYDVPSEHQVLGGGVFSIVFDPKTPKRRKVNP